jgi:hypothetical protein
MTRLVLALSIAALLLLAVALGWLLGWLWRRGRDRRGPEDPVAAMAARLHAAEAARDAAEARLSERAAALETAAAEADAARARAVAEAEAERAAAVSALGDARRETAAWREAYEALVREDREDP